MQLVLYSRALLLFVSSFIGLGFHTGCVGDVGSKESTGSPKAVTREKFHGLLMQHVIHARQMLDKEDLQHLSSGDAKSVVAFRALFDKRIKALARRAAVTTDDGHAKMVTETACYFKEVAGCLDVKLDQKVSRFIDHIERGKIQNPYQQYEALHAVAEVLQKKIDALTQNEGVLSSIAPSLESVDKVARALTYAPYFWNIAAFVVPVVTSGFVGAPLELKGRFIWPVVFGTAGLLVHAKQQSDNEAALASKLREVLIESNPKYIVKKELDRDTKKRLEGVIDGVGMPFSQLIGIDDKVRAEVQKHIINPAVNPFKYLPVFTKGKHAVMLYGEPGVGKSFLIRAIRSEIEKEGRNVPFYEVPPAFFADKSMQLLKVWVKAIHKQAVDRGATAVVLAIDEVGNSGMADRENLLLTVSQQQGKRESADPGLVLSNMLTFLDGADIKFTLPTVIVLAGNNLFFDEAVLRPERTDKCIKIPLPGVTARTEVLTAFFPSLSTEEVGVLVKKTKGMTLADLMHIKSTVAAESKYDQPPVRVFDRVEKIIGSMVEKKVAVGGGGSENTDDSKEKESAHVQGTLVKFL